MRVHDWRDEEGRLVAFEVGNSILSRQDFALLVGRIPGVAVMRAPKFLSWWREDEFCEFVVDGHGFKAVEMFGDNSRYTVFPVPPEPCPQLDIVRSAFAGHKPWLVPFSGLFRRLGNALRVPR